jgi:hypothetical protein
MDPRKKLLYIGRWLERGTQILVGSLYGKAIGQSGQTRQANDGFWQQA